MTGDHDPLEGAGVGETREFDYETQTWLYDWLPSEYQGLDRDVTIQNVETQLVEDEYGDQRLEIQINGEATKWLPRRWDHCNEPRTEEEHRQRRRRTWLKRSVFWLSNLTVVGIATVIAHHVTTAAWSGVTIDGEPVQPPELWPVMLTVGAIAMLAIAVTRRWGTNTGGSYA